MHLFYVEKEPFLMNLFEMQLKDEGHTIYTTDDLDLIHLIEDQVPDLILISTSFGNDAVIDLYDKIKNIKDLKSKIGLIGKGNEILNLKDNISIDFELTGPIVPLKIVSNLLKHCQG